MSMSRGLPDMHDMARTARRLASLGEADAEQGLDALRMRAFCLLALRKLGITGRVLLKQLKQHDGAKRSSASKGYTVYTTLTLVFFIMQSCEFGNLEKS